MKRLVPFLCVGAALLLGACSLAGDVTPPPGLENVQVAPESIATPLTAPRQAPDLAAGEILFSETMCPMPR